MKDSGKRAKCRYNYQTGFRRKMLQYKTATNDDIAVQFYPSTKTGPGVCRFATSPELARKTAVSTKSTETCGGFANVTPSATSPTVEVAGPSKKNNANITTPSKKSPSTTPENSKSCRKCRLSYGTKMDDAYNSVWVNCNTKKCDYWVHLKCLGFALKDEDNPNPIEELLFFCPSHQERLPKPKRILKRKL